MKSLTRPLTALTSSLALLAATLVPWIPAQAEVLPDAFDPSTVLRSSPAPEPGELLAFDMNRVVTQQTRLIRYQATEYQRKVAEERARAYMAAQRRAEAQATTASKTQAKPKPKPVAKEEPAPKKGQKPKPTEPKAPEPAVAETKPAAPKKLPRYIAVDTVKDKRAAPGTKKVVMIWDTHAEALVGNNIYDVQNPPPVGSTSTFETYSAQYIGAGL